MNNDTAQLIYNKFKDKEFNNHYTVKHLYAELLKATAHTLDLPQLLPIADQFKSPRNALSYLFHPAFPSQKKHCRIV